MPYSQHQLKAMFADQAQLPSSLTLDEQQQIIEILLYDNLLATFSLKYGEAFSSLFEPKLQRQIHTAELHATRLQHLCLQEMISINKILRQANITPIFLKGGAYVGNKTHCHLGRMFSDIDVLVEKQQIALAEKKLKHARWVSKIIDDYDENYYRTWAHEIPPMFHYDRHAVLDLHHNLAMPISGRAPNIEDFKFNLQQHNSLTTLSPEGMTLHSAIHLFFNEEFNHGLRDIHDLHLLMTEFNSPEYWQTLVSLATKSQFELELYLACRYCKKIFNTQVPQDIYQTLKSKFNNPIKQYLWDFMFLKILGFNHPKVKPRFFNLATQMAFVRGHYLKMPLTTLIKHISFKMYRSTVEMLLGRAFFEEPEKKIKL